VQHPQSSANEGLIPFIPGGGLTRRFLEKIPSGWSLPLAALLHFVVEGDNRADANLFAVVVAKVLAADTLIREWKQPTSWTQGLFGTAHDQSLYG
jgi:proteasome assembly chaperone 2